MAAAGQVADPLAGWSQPVDSAQDSAVHYKSPDVAGALQSNELLEVDHALHIQDALQAGQVGLDSILEQEYLPALESEEGLGYGSAQILQHGLRLLHAGGYGSPGSGYSCPLKGQGGGEFVGSPGDGRRGIDHVNSPLLQGHQRLEAEGHIAGTTSTQVADKDGIKLLQIQSGTSEFCRTVNKGHEILEIEKIGNNSHSIKGGQQGLGGPVGWIGDNYGGAHELGLDARYITIALFGRGGRSGKCA